MGLAFPLRPLGLSMSKMAALLKVQALTLLAHLPIVCRFLMMVTPMLVMMVSTGLILMVAVPIKPIVT